MEKETTIKEVKDRVFAVVIPDDYERCMTFLRVQEYYESPNPDFRGKHFDIWKYIEWYSRDRGLMFTYPADWGGFNVPLSVAVDCYRGVAEMPGEWTSGWDSRMRSIVDRVLQMVPVNRRSLPAYIIGTDEASGQTFKHEVAHGLYHTNLNYRAMVDAITADIKTVYMQSLGENLERMGYTEVVLWDEVHAYFTAGWRLGGFSKGVPDKVCEDLSKRYNEVFSRF
jgi:hypothetical protein